MAEITAALVRQLREETNLPMMDCKQALTESGGDKEAAKEHLRKKGLKIQEGRGGRETAFGRFGIYAGVDNSCRNNVHMVNDSQWNVCSRNRIARGNRSNHRRAC